MASITLRSDQTLPLTSAQVDANFSALNTSKAELNSPIFTGTPKSTTAPSLLEASTLSELSTTLGNTDIITTSWFQSQLAKLSVPALLPAVDAIETEQFDENNESTGFTYSGVNLGSPTKKFAQLFVKNAKFSANSIELGDALLSGSTEGGVVLPTNTAIGTADNVLPENLASSVLDSNFSENALTRSTLKLSFTADESFGQTTTSPTFLWLNSAGKVQKVTSTNPFNKLFIGVCTSATLQGNLAEVILSGGPVGGFGNLVTGQEYYLDTDGTISPTSSSTNVKIGKATSGSDLFIYSTSTLDIYALSKSKVGLDGFSIGTIGSPQGFGGITYNSQLGEFAYFPPQSLNNLNLIGNPTAPTAVVGTNNTQIASTEFVTTSISNLVGSAPEVLDTLQELALAIGNDGSFATTITNSIATKAPLADPALTGTPTAPTAGAGTNTTQIATTEYVQTSISGTANLNNPALTGIPTAPTAAAGTDTTQIATTAFVKTAVALGGGASNMDGGVAQTTRNLATHHFNGGTASG